MKELRITLTETEHKQLWNQKGINYNWHDFLMLLTNVDSKRVK